MVRWLPLLLVGISSCIDALELTPENWDRHTAGKMVFIKFYAPWCGHSQAIKPAWDKLMKKYAGSSSALVADVDCMGDGKVLCEERGVQGFPTIKWGDPNLLEDWEGGREYSELVEWSEANLKPVCSPSHISLCDARTRAEIERLMELSDEDLDLAIQQKDAEFQEAEDLFDSEVNKLPVEYARLDNQRIKRKTKEAEEVFDAEVKKLQEVFARLEKEKNEKQAAIRGSGQILLKSVMAYRSATSRMNGKTEL